MSQYHWHFNAHEKHSDQGCRSVLRGLDEGGASADISAFQLTVQWYCTGESLVSVHLRSPSALNIYPTVALTYILIQ